MTYTWDASTRRYRDQQSGRLIRTDRIAGLRDRIVTATLTKADALSAQLAAGDLTVEAWTLGMRDLVKQVTIEQYLLARGGRNAMGPRDWGRIGYQLRTQYGYLQQFAAEVDAGRLSDKQIAARARLYIEATRSAFERANGAAWGVLLPAHPGDGGSECGVNCRCRWRLSANELGEVEATWVIDSAAESCGTCQERAEQWAPLVFPAPMPGIEAPIAA